MNCSALRRASGFEASTSAPSTRSGANYSSRIILARCPSVPYAEESAAGGALSRKRSPATHGTPARRTNLAAHKTADAAAAPSDSGPSLRVPGLRPPCPRPPSRFRRHTDEEPSNTTALSACGSESPGQTSIRHTQTSATSSYRISSSSIRPVSHEFCTAGLPEGPRRSSNWLGTGRAGAGSALAAALVALQAVSLSLPETGPLLTPPAAARIPTETVLSDGRGSGNGGGLGQGIGGALSQLGTPRAAVLVPAAQPTAAVSTGAAGDFVDWPSPSPLPSGSAASSSSLSSSLSSSSTPVPAAAAAARTGGAARVPGSMVGTPNYARSAAGRAAAASRSTASEAAEALQLLTSARQAVDDGRHDQALELYGRLVSEHSDLALAEYGRIGRAMLLYQVGKTSDSILALEDEEVSMRGAAEVHAALAALLYAERPSLALRAEEEWNMACLFDKRYSNPEWVRVNKHWPPRMIAALQKFLSLS